MYSRYLPNPLSKIMQLFHFQKNRISLYQSKIPMLAQWNLTVTNLGKIASSKSGGELSRPGSWIVDWKAE
jgi:hypothetical protein